MSVPRRARRRVVLEEDLAGEWTVRDTHGKAETIGPVESLWEAAQLAANLDNTPTKGRPR